MVLSASCLDTCGLFYRCRLEWSLIVFFVVRTSRAVYYMLIGLFYMLIALIYVLK